MNCFRNVIPILLHNIFRKQDITCSIIVNIRRCTIVNKHTRKSLCTTTCLSEEDNVPKALRNTKPKAQEDTRQHFVDIKQVKTMGGKGGDGEISFLQLWSNEQAGPDGGDGGSGGHVIFEVSADVKDLAHVTSVIRANDGEKGYSKNCFGKNAEHMVIKVPLGTIIRNTEGSILADLDKMGMMFVAARGGAGGHGNAFFKSDTHQTPRICEYGAHGEEIQYVLEVRSMAHIGLMGLPNAGKSTLLRAISRARPKVAPYPFTTLKPHIGVVSYEDYEQVSVADMPGLISDAHKNRGLGISFLKHAERCAALLFILDLSLDEPWNDLETLKYEIGQFNEKLNKKPALIVANKIDLPNAMENLKLLQEKTDLPIIPISAKVGTNLSALLKEIRILYDNMKENEPKLEEDSV